MNMSVMNQPLMKYVNLALSYVEDARLAQALNAGFVENEGRLARYANTYRRITSHPWTRDSLCVFFCGWRSPDGAAHAVSSIIVRLLQESESIGNPVDRLKVLKAARNCGEIIVEDIGLGEMHGHPHHAKLYHRLASAVCGSDAWRLQDRFLNPITKEFSAWVGKKRPLAKDLTEAIEMMIMTELFNTGEYNLMTPLWKKWLLTYYTTSSSEVKHISSFLAVHCGSVEARHFEHATGALGLYCTATNQKINYDRMAALSREYVVRACEHLEKMASVLVADNQINCVSV